MPPRAPSLHARQANSQRLRNAILLIQRRVQLVIDSLSNDESLRNNLSEELVMLETARDEARAALGDTP
jgi:hypothetical protein